MQAFVNNIIEGLNALIYYLKAGIALVTSNKYMLAASVFILLSVGTSFNIGKVISYRKK